MSAVLKLINKICIKEVKFMLTFGKIYNYYNNGKNGKIRRGV